MSFNYSFYGRKPDASAHKVAGMMEPFERFKKIANMGRVKAYTIIPHIKDLFVFPWLYPKLYFRIYSFGAVFNSIAKQVLNY